MNAQVKIATLILSLVGSVTVMADQAPSKQATRIDFNKMIDENNSQKAELQKDMGARAESAAAARSDSDKKRVSDFVDVEVGWGKNRPVVDRRFNSVGKARVVKVGQTDVNVRLISKKKANKGS